MVAIEAFIHHLIAHEERMAKMPIAHAWLSDVTQAKEEAAKENKILLIAFVGPGWCHWSDKLIKEVLAKEPFTSCMQRDFVLLKVDFPENSSELSALKEEYQVEECPLLVLTEPSGKTIAKIGYMPLGPEAYATYIKETLRDFHFVRQAADPLCLKDLKVDDLKAAYAKAKRFTGDNFAKVILETGLKIDSGTFFLIEQYASLLTKAGREHEMQEMRSKIVERDPQNERGSLLRIALLDFENMARGVKKKEPLETIRPLADYLHHYGKSDPDNAWKVEMKISEYLFAHNQLDESLKHARASLESAPEKNRKEIAEAIDYLQTQLE